MKTSEQAAKWLRDVADMLVEKGVKYGDSIGQPVRIFSQAGQADGIRIRLDDKLSRIAKGQAGDEDVIKDLVGYLALLAVSEQKNTGTVNTAFGQLNWTENPLCNCSWCVGVRESKASEETK